MGDVKDFSARHLLVTVLGMFLLLAIGVFGYISIEGWSILDALYMTIITMSTVGYQEVAPMNPAGRLFSMFLIMSGLVILAMFTASITTFFVRQELLSNYRVRKMRKEIRNLRGHTILCGAGETGKTVIREFSSRRKPLVVIEESPQMAKYALEQYPELLIIEGDATKDEFLVEANIEEAAGLITAIAEDALNLFVVISARAFNPGLRIVARSVDPHTASKMYKAGADHVISPNLTEGMRMAATMLNPHVVSFLDIMASDDIGLKLEELTVSESSDFIGKTLRELAIPRKTGLIVIGIRQGDDSSKFTYNPGSETVIHKEDALIVLGSDEKLDRLEALLQD